MADGQLLFQALCMWYKFQLVLTCHLNMQCVVHVVEISMNEHIDN